MQRNSIRVEKVLFALLSLFVFAYVLLKSISMPFVLDEGISFFRYIYPNTFWPFTGHPSANNHFLNSFLVWVSTRLFGYSNLSIRLPNLLAFWVYVGFLYALGSQLKTRLVKWSFWITLISIAGVLDFFTLSRGYGLSFALLFGFIYYGLKYTQQADQRSAYVAVLVSSLACLANLNLVYIHTLFLAYLFFRLLKREQGVLGPFIAAGVLQVYFVLSLLVLKNSGQLFLGEGITAVESLESIFVNSFYQDRHVAFVVFGLQLTATAILLTSLKQSRLLNRPLFYLTLLMLGNIAAIVFAKILLDVNWPLNRTAMHIYLIFLLVFFFAVNQVKVRWLVPLLLILALPLPIQSFNQYSISRVVDDEWAAQQIPQEFLEKIESLGYNHAFLIAEPWTIHSFLLQAFVKSDVTFQVQVAQQTHGNADFLIAYPSSHVPPGFVQVAENKSKTLRLWHKAFRPAGMRIVDESGQLASSDREFQDIGQKIALPASVKYFTAQVSLAYEYDPGFSGLVFVFQTENEKGEVVDWQKVDLDQLGNIASEKKKSLEFEFELKDTSDDEPTVIQVLILNPQKKHLTNLKYQYTIWGHD